MSIVHYISTHYIFLREYSRSFIINRLTLSQSHHVIFMPVSLLVLVGGVLYRNGSTKVRSNSASVSLLPPYYPLTSALSFSLLFLQSISSACSRSLAPTLTLTLQPKRSRLIYKLLYNHCRSTRLSAVRGSRCQWLVIHVQHVGKARPSNQLKLL